MQKYFFILFSIFIAFSCSSRQKVVVAHRGAPGYLPEHTLEGVAMAHSFDVDYIEPDLVMTKDNQVVVLHDIHLDTVTDVATKFPKRKRSDGRYYAVDFNLSEIKKLNVHERIDLKTGKRVFEKRFSLNQSSFQVPTFIEFIELIQTLNKTRSKNIGIYPEIKSPEFHIKEKKDITKIVYTILKEYGYDSSDAKIFVQCFYPPTLIRLREEFNAKFPQILLIAENSWGESSINYDFYKTEKGLSQIAPYVDGIGPYLKQLVTINKRGKVVPSNLAEMAHKLNLKVHPYTHRSDVLEASTGFKREKDFFNFLYEEVKADGIFSDFSDIALRYSRQ